MLNQRYTSRHHHILSPLAVESFCKALIDKFLKKIHFDENTHAFNFSLQHDVATLNF